MSTLWTPGGEHPVGKPAGPGGAGPDDTGRGSSPEGPPGPTDDEALAQQLAAMRAELASAPAEVVVANHCYGLFELAAVYLSHQPARLEDARLAIDALGSLVERLQGRLGDAETQLKDGLSQLRLAYVQIDGAQRAGAEAASGAAANGGAAETAAADGGAAEAAAADAAADDGAGRGGDSGMGPEPPDPDG